jgi:hypothetical protein
LTPQSDSLKLRVLQLLRLLLHPPRQLLFISASSFFEPPPRPPSPIICAARIPAFVAPGFPIATVATGIPAGICTVASNESSPFSEVEGIGTPITGKSRVRRDHAQPGAPPRPRPR